MAYISPDLYPLGSAPSGVQQWQYLTTDSFATVSGAGYFTDGALQGMNPGDGIAVIIYSTYASGAFSGFSSLNLGTVASTSGYAATIAAIAGTGSSTLTANSTVTSGFPDGSLVSATSNKIQVATSLPNGLTLGDGAWTVAGNADASKMSFGGWAAASGAFNTLLGGSDFAHYYIGHNFTLDGSGNITTTYDSTSTSYVAMFTDNGLLNVYEAPAVGGAGAPTFAATPTFSLNMLTGALSLNGVAVALSNDARFTGLGGPVTKNADWTFVATDVGKLYRCTDTGTHAWTLDTFANAPIAAGQTIVGTNESTATLTVVAPAGGSLIRLDGTAGTGTRTIGAASQFSLLKLDGANAWGISGTALS
jgi:hypothetical protein